MMMTVTAGKWQQKQWSCEGGVIVVLGIANWYILNSTDEMFAGIISILHAWTR
jgi:hypothetical protein